MARNIASMSGRIGAVKDRSQVYNSHNDRWTKRWPDGKFMDQKADHEPFKGITKENPELEEETREEQETPLDQETSA